MFVVDHKEKSPCLNTNSFVIDPRHFFLYDLLQIYSYLWLIIEIVGSASRKK